LAELKRLNDCYDKLDDKIDLLRGEVIMLKAKAAAWGGLGGAIGGAALGFIVSQLTKGG
jgi:hypothetical protein